MYSASVLYGTATQAYERTKNDGADRAPGNMDALVAVVFGVAAFEAFINEIPEHLQAVYGLTPTEPAVLSLLATLLEEAEQARASTEFKLVLTTTVLSGRPYDRGTALHQDYALLTTVRNELIHLKPKDRLVLTAGQDFVVEPRKVIDRLRSKDILAVGQWDMMELITTRAVARWACNVVADMVQEVVMAVPESSFKSMLNALYGYTFPRVE